MSLPYTIRKVTYRGRPGELLTFTGSTEEDYDIFLDARFAEDREALGWRQDAAAPSKRLDSGRLVWCQFRRLLVED